MISTKKVGDGMRLLMIEDDQALCAATKISLERAGYQVDLCHDGRDGLQLALQGTHDILLVDRMLPGLDGLSLVSVLRKSGINTTALMLTALGGIYDRVDGLDAGADDYLVKPFAVDELLARLRALSRRPAAWTQADVINCHDMTFDPLGKVLAGPSGNCTLSSREGDLLEALLRADGRTIPRAVLFSRVWGADAEVEDNNLDSYIHFLRRRFKAVGSSSALKTVYGVGYRLEGPPC